MTSAAVDKTSHDLDFGLRHLLDIFVNGSVAFANRAKSLIVMLLYGISSHESVWPHRKYP